MHGRFLGKKVSRRAPGHIQDAYPAPLRWSAFHSSSELRTGTCLRTPRILNADMSLSKDARLLRVRLAADPMRFFHALLRSELDKSRLCGILQQICHYEGGCSSRCRYNQ